MQFIPIFYNLILPLFLFGLVFCSISVLTYPSKHRLQLTTITQSATLEKSSTQLLNQQHYHLACLLEDAPASALTGQFYELATPLMTPLACLLEDAPASALTGQFYPLATPLACILTRNWHQFYTQKLGQPGINYWEWKDNPESSNICPELSRLLNLRQPQGYAKDVLEALGSNRNPFEQLSPNKKINKDRNLSANFTDYKHQGEFYALDPQVQIEMRLAFKQWHETARKQIGINMLQGIYQVCYSTSWAKIQQIIDIQKQATEAIFIDELAPWWKILGVKPSANTLQVERAYKNLIRMWHPDVNKHPQATQMTSLINVAYEKYQSLQRVSCISPKTIVVNQTLLIKIRGWIKPLFR